MVGRLHGLKLGVLVQLLLLHVDQQAVADALAQPLDVRQHLLELHHGGLRCTAELARLLVVHIQAVLVTHPVELGDTRDDAPVKGADAVREELALVRCERQQHLRGHDTFSGQRRPSRGPQHGSQPPHIQDCRTPEPHQTPLPVTIARGCLCSAACPS
jgi:hypothetical protein